MFYSILDYIFVVGDEIVDIPDDVLASMKLPEKDKERFLKSWLKSFIAFYNYWCLS